MFLIRKLIKLFSLLNSNVRSSQLAAGVSCGLLLALIPSANLLWVVLFLVLFFTKANYAMSIFCMVVVKLFSPLFSPLLDQLGWAVLHSGALQNFYTVLYNMPIAPLTGFNNTLVAGGLVAGLLLWVPVFFLMQYLIPLYRRYVAPYIIESRIYAAFKRLPLVKSLSGLVSRASSLTSTR